MATTPDETLHMSPREAMKAVISLCIAEGNNPEFIEAVTKAKAKGLEVFSRKQLWKLYGALTNDGANGELFADPEGPDASAFLAVLEQQGKVAARRWLGRRLIVVPVAPVLGDGGGYIHRVIYYPVQSALDDTRRKQPTTTRRETVKLTEE
jgi:hypothetical protein